MSEPELALERGARTVLVYGDPRIWVDRSAERVEAWGLGRCGLRAFNHQRYRVTDERGRDALVVARTVPMMADLRVVVVRDLEQIADAFAEDLLGYLASPNPSTLLILVAGRFSAPKKGEKAWGTRIANAVKANGLVIHHKAEGVDRRGFAREYARSVGIDLPEREANTFVEMAGEDLDVLVQELEKLATYLGPGGRVTGRDLEAVCSLLAEEVIWELTGGIARRDAASALRALHRLTDGGQEGHYLLAMVAMQLRKVTEAQQRLRSGQSPGQVATTLRMRQQEVDEVRRGLGHAPSAVQVAEALVKANRDLNGGKAAPERVLEVLVVDLVR